MCYTVVKDLVVDFSRCWSSLLLNPNTAALTVAFLKSDAYPTQK